MISTDIAPIDPTDPMTPPPGPAPGIAPGAVTEAAPAETPAAEPAPATEWRPAHYKDGRELPPAMYRRYGETADGLREWAEVNSTRLGIPGRYNAAVLDAAAETITRLTLRLVAVKSSLTPIQHVLDGSSLQNPEVRAALVDALDTIRQAVAGIEGGAN